MTANNEIESDQSHRRWTVHVLNIATVVLAASFLGIGSWASYHAPLRNDQYQLIQLGESVYHGGRMYMDCWENKPPGIAWINALGLVLTSGDPLGPWLLPMATAAAALAALWMAARRLLTIRSARRVVLIAALTMSLRVYDAPSINPDFYASVIELAAIAVWLFGFRRVGGDVPKSRVATVSAMCAGLLWSGATTCKQVGCIGLVAVTIIGLALVGIRHYGAGRWIRNVLPAWVGFAIGIGVVASVLAWQGTLGEAWSAVISFNFGFVDWKALAGEIGGGRIRADLAPLAPFLWLALLGFVATLHAGRAGELTRASVIAILLWWLGAAAFAVQGPSRSMRYWQATFAPMIWLTGTGVLHIQDAQERLNRTQRLTFILVAVTALVVLMRPMLYEIRVGLASSYAENTEHPNEREKLIQIGRQIQRLVSPDERIYVWGYHAGLYVYGDRRAASRFTYPRSTAQMEEILADLEGGGARAFLIPRRRSAEFSQFCDTTCHERLNHILLRYQSTGSIGPYDAWVRSSTSDEPVTTSSP